MLLFRPFAASRRASASFRMLLWPFMLFSLCVVFTGRCKTREGVPQPDTETILRVFDSCGSSAEPVTTALPPVSIIVDDSLSMRGFVDAPASAYRKLVRKFLEKSVASGYAVQVRGFSGLDTREGLPNALTTILNGSFYHVGDTPLAALFTRIASAQERKIYVVVSDMVQSETGRDSLALTSAFREAVGATPSIALYAFRSAFRGRYYVETPPKRQELLDVPDDGGRPFYILVLTPSPESLQEFERYAGIGPLTSGDEVGVQSQTFYPSASPIEVQGVQWVNPLPKRRSAWNGEAPQEKRCPGGTFLQACAFQRSTVPSGREELVFSLQTAAKQTVILPSRYHVEISKADLSSKAPVARTARAASADVTGKPGDPSATLTYRFEKPGPDTWSVYRVRFRAGAGNLGLPGWVKAWSTQDDHEDPARTLNLATVVEAMVRASSENVVFFDHIIELHGERK